MQRPDWLIAESADYYHKQAKENLSSHQLIEFINCPLMYFKKLTGLIKDRDSQCYSFGRAAHTLILEGREVFEDEYAVGGPVNPKTGKEYGSNTKAFAAWADEIGKPVISSEELVILEFMQNQVLTHRQAPSLITGGVAEAVCRTEYCGLPSQIRMDYFNPDKGIVDLKTCDSLDKFEFDARRYGYISQLAFYRAVLKEASGIQYDVHIIAVEKKEPFRCGVWKISAMALNEAQRENEQHIEELKKCIESDFWPTRFEDIRLLERY
ncbi:MAG: PD-(D/E)XK nuclease-like domain-containing protein [Sedimentisphaeraceae bacterium JB056]